MKGLTIPPERRELMNIYDIAEQCGVSIATVSRVLNNSPNVRAQTRERILAVMQEKGYTPNACARGLGLGSMRQVGVLCTHIEDAFQATAVAYIEERLRTQEMNAILRCTGSTAQGKQEALRYILQQQVDALLVLDDAYPQQDLSQIEAIAARMPVILLNSHLEIPGVYSITCDEQTAVAELMGHLFRRQRRDVLFLYHTNNYSCREKINGYHRAYAAAGLQSDDKRILQVNRDLDDINACIKQLLVKQVHFDAVIASDDLLALGAQKALLRIGLNMPIVGFANSMLARCATPELTSVDTHLQTLCATAMDTLDKVLAGETAPTHTQIPCQLMERDSFRIN